MRAYERVALKPLNAIKRRGDSTARDLAFDICISSSSDRFFGKILRKERIKKGNLIQKKKAKGSGGAFFYIYIIFKGAAI